MKKLLQRIFGGVKRVKFYVTQHGKSGESLDLPIGSVIFVLLDKLDRCDNLDDLYGSVDFEKDGYIYTIRISGGRYKPNNDVVS
jgi:hypothetical protein